MERQTRQARSVGVAQTRIGDINHASDAPDRRVAHGSAPLRIPLRIGLAAVILVAVVGCASPSSSTTTSPTAAASTTAAAAQSSPAEPVPAANASAGPASTTPASTTMLGARAPVPLDVAPAVSQRPAGHAAHADPAGRLHGVCLRCRPHQSALYGDRPRRHDLRDRHERRPDLRAARSQQRRRRRRGPGLGRRLAPAAWSRHFSTTFCTSAKPTASSASASVRTARARAIPSQSSPSCRAGTVTGPAPLGSTRTAGSSSRLGRAAMSARRDDERRAAISVYNADGSDGRVFMRGLRNAVGLSGTPTPASCGRPTTAATCSATTCRSRRSTACATAATPAGRTATPRPAACWQTRSSAGQTSVQTVDPPAVTFQAHSAPLGLRFYDGTSFPEALHGDLFVALHGSWNRSAPVGYKVIRIPFVDGTPGQAEDFATGWMASEGTAAACGAGRSTCWSRPTAPCSSPTTTAARFIGSPTVPREEP